MLYRVNHSCATIFSALLVTRRARGMALGKLDAIPAFGPLVTVAEVLPHRDSVKFVDASWHLPSPGGTRRDARAEFRDSRISNARFFDIDRVADTSSDLPHMLPSEAQFAGERQTLLSLWDPIQIMSSAAYERSVRARFFFWFRGLQ